MTHLDEAQLEIAVRDWLKGDLGCEYVYVKGCSKPERISKVQYYAQYVKESTAE